MDRINNIGEYIKQRYETLGLQSLEELAKRIGVSRQTLYNWANEGTEIRVSNLLKLARALQAHPVEVLRIVTRKHIPYPIESQPAVRFDDSGFIDETIPDCSVVCSGVVFTKEWLIQNTGTRIWKGRKLVCQNNNEQLYVNRQGKFLPFHSCQLHTDAPEIPIPTTEPSELVRLKTTFTAPLLPGRAVSIWKIEDANGKLSYPDKPGYWCDVVVTGFY